MLYLVPGTFQSYNCACWPGCTGAWCLVHGLSKCSTPWFGIVCSSWVWMSRSTTGRNGLNVLGNVTESTMNGNRMVSRVVLLFMLASARGAACFLEQPVTSLMYLHERFQELHPHRLSLSVLCFLYSDILDVI